MSDPDLRVDVLVWRVRLIAACVGLTAVAFRQKPGLVVADTKLDLTVDPWGFLASALHLWDPQGAFGQLQNQAYGYLFPMGPFHAVLSSAGVSPWVTQRLWWSLLMCVAFLGMWRLTTELDVGSPWLRLVGGLVFALSPRLASELTVTSVEVWPMAVAPWVLLPLVARGDRSWAWRISRSALAFAATGGVNAVASGAALILPTLWFLTRRVSWRLGGAFAAWLGAVTLAMSWWLLPLLLLGRNSPPFLDWIEGAAATTSTASPFETLRGTSAWLGFLTSPVGPEWPGGWAYLTQPGVVVGTAVLAGLGLAGLCLAHVRERTFLAVSLLMGFVLLGAGHAGVLGSPLAVPIQEFLDGPLAALRNTHKFDAVVRIPLTIGAVALLSSGAERLRRLGVAPWAPPLAVVSLLVMITAPTVVAGLARGEAYAQVPAHWRQVATWLDSQPDRGSVLVLPGASFADFTWGSTKDDPLQPLMKRPFAVRDAVPLGSAGATRWLDGVQRELGEGKGGSALARTLATAGIRFVVMRNDLRLDAQGDPSLAIEAGLERSGIYRVAGFGPLTGNPGESPAVTVDYRTLIPRQSVEVYRVPGAADAWIGDVQDTPVVAAGPEDSAAVAEDTGSRLAMLGTDSATAGVKSHAGVVATDGLRRREVNFGEPSHNTSHVLSATESVRQRRPVTEFDADPTAPRTTSTWDGISGVRTSSSASDATATLRLGPASGPGAALDGDPKTRWVSGTFGRATGEWLQVDLPSARRVAAVRIDVSTESPVSAAPAELEVSTEAGARRVTVGPDGAPVFVGLPTGNTRWLRVTLSTVRAGPQNGFALSELALSGVTPRQLLRIPSSDQPDRIVLRADSGERSGCLYVDGHDYCSPRLSTAGEGPSDLARQVSLGSAGEYTMSGTVRSLGSTATDALFDLGQRLSAKASSRLVEGPADRPGAALDQDLRTAWVAGTNDFDPTFTVTLPEARSVSGLQFIRDSQLAASGAKSVRVTFPGGNVVRGNVDEEGYLRFTGHRTQSLTVEFAETRPMVDIDSETGARSFVPVGFSELRVLGAEDLRQPSPLDAPTGAPCGFGPTLTVNGKAFPTRVEGTLNEVRRGLPMRWSLCGQDGVALVGAVNDVSAKPSGEFRPDSLTFVSSEAREQSARVVPLVLDRPSPTRLSLSLPERSSEVVVVVPQNFNQGWVTAASTQDVRPIRINGWMQGWVVRPGEATTLDAVFEPDAPYRAALGLGAALLVFLSVVALWSRRSSGRAAVTASAVLPAWVALGLVALAGLAVGGSAGLALGMAAGCAGLWARRSLRLALASASCLLPVAASVIVAVDPWPGGRANLDSAAVQTLSLVGVLLAAGLSLVHPARSTGQVPPASSSPARELGASKAALAHRS